MTGSSQTVQLRSIVDKGSSTIGFSVGKLTLNVVRGSCEWPGNNIAVDNAAVIGRSDSCDIILDGTTVSRNHCEIKRLGNTYIIEDKSRNGTYVNNKRIVSTMLSNGDKIRVGQTIIEVQYNSGSKTTRFSSKSTRRLTEVQRQHNISQHPMIFIKGTDTSITQPFNLDRITIGRRPDNHIVFEDDNISRMHLTIERRDKYYFALDMGSINGTYKNGKRIGTAEKLISGDILKIGDYNIHVTVMDRDCLLNFWK